MSTIESVHGRRVWDSRGNPTVEAEVRLESGAIGRAIAPAGASRGSREAVDLRDKGQSQRGLDVKTAVRNVSNRIAPVLKGLDVTDQRGIDAAMLAVDASPTKSSLGGNATVAVSMAAMRAAAEDADVPLWKHVADHYGTKPKLPLPEIQVFGGGAHASRRTDIQDLIVMGPGAPTIDAAFDITAEIYHAAGAIMSRRGRLAGVADEGGWWPEFESNEEALATLSEAIIRAGETPGDRVVISLDVAASEFFDNDVYSLALEDRSLSGDDLSDVLSQWLSDYAIASVEDPMGEADDAGMIAFTTKHGDRLQIIGDDYLVTNAELVGSAARNGACNAVLLKPNQVGTISETVDCFLAARAAGWGAIVSARSGETEDTFISHLATGLGTGQLKVGSFARSERMAKWNECLRIAEDPDVGGFVGGEPLAGTWWAKQEKGVKP